MHRLVLSAVRTASRAASRPRAHVASFSAVQYRSFSSEEIIPGVGKGKTSTGLVGVPVDHDAVPKIIVKYQALLDKMAASDMPPEAEYRQVIEKISRYRIKAAQENLDDPEKVEELCNCGQVEELVEQADDEMMVLDMYLKERWWEYVKDVPIEYDPASPGDDQDGVDWEVPPEKNEEAKAAEAKK
uniref:NADH dehydrogenase [ubiquinone] 1 alpha subcomplex subunit 5 n=1 Tax=Odontella aurita TaxID=265563 RepID=A0A7S4N1U0_9STRA|mmetsp:Transcript_43488/g.132324  ORF Transcript_43488/g.132324 Transcript_43488/m.132324 type:complete len:186 (+) Transcript_43488:74-631(+)|eukprot:CAMPEP_0113540358 /NCGR_PEP_ID=MMETSP0015_2-20120614/8435_1 /TAXON_ID=2838 /ORGANISM="Odontella" /LENGTH=185 /DNA_ID=CAMNT_0000440151 /DNA_START=16 /DNA_END=573 /DNA_ORIENTATION=+ /assembly_acc=CAM_ASM_000160